MKYILYTQFFCPFGNLSSIGTTYVGTINLNRVILGKIIVSYSFEISLTVS